MNKYAPYMIGLAAVGVGIFIAMKYGDKVLDKAGVKSSLKNTIWEAVSTRISNPDVRARATAATTATPRGFGELY